jgi:hypothetical protein
MLFSRTKCVEAVPKERNESKDGKSSAENSVSKLSPKNDDVDMPLVLLFIAVITASLFLDRYDDNDASTDVVCVEPDKKDEVAVANVLCIIVTAGLSAVALPSSGVAASFEPHITRSIGNSLAQLLTNRAVLTAFALGGDGGGSGCSSAGEVDTRRSCVVCPANGGDVSGGQYDGG